MKRLITLLALLALETAVGVTVEIVLHMPFYLTMSLIAAVLATDTALGGEAK